MGNRFKAATQRESNLEVGARVTFRKVQLGSGLQAWKNQMVGTVVEVLGSGAERRYVVDVFAPDQGEEDAMNPFLARFSVEGLCPAQLLLDNGGKTCGFTAIGRKRTSFCSVPLAELHAKGCGESAHGRSARLGGLLSRQELEGLTGTVIDGPDPQGMYSIKMMLEEGELDTVVASAENITLRLRRSALPQLLNRKCSESWEAASGSEGVPFLAAVYHEASDGPSQPTVPSAAKRKVHFCPSVSVEPISARPSRLVSLSSAAAEALVASGDVPQHALTEVSEANVSERDRKFEALDDELASYCEGSGIASRLAATQALGPSIDTKS